MVISASVIDAIHLVQPAHNAQQALLAVQVLVSNVLMIPLAADTNA